MHLPDALTAADGSQATSYLQTYYSQYTGRHFDERAASLGDVFTPDDVVAVSYLSVYVPGESARLLLVDQREKFADLIAAVGPDRDLVDVEETITTEWPGRVLNRSLRELPGVGPVTATKLCARLRPRLFPIWDSVIADVTGCYGDYWEPLRLALRADDRWLDRRLVDLRTAAGLMETTSTIRVFDVITWMSGKALGAAAATGSIGG